jgi:acetate---CoA ligase (ADP-forming)
MTSTVPRHSTTAAFTGIGALFTPRGIAVVGASRDQSKLGATLARSLSAFAARGGHLALVNGRDETMHPSLAAAAARSRHDLRSGRGLPHGVERRRTSRGRCRGDLRRRVR